MLKPGASGGGHVSRKRFHTVLLDSMAGETGEQDCLGVYNSCSLFTPKQHVSTLK